MEECEMLNECTFLKTYKDDEKVSTSIKGFMGMYCKGEKVDSCKRRMIYEKFGDCNAIPSNMMPNGYPLPGTNDAEWSDAIKMLLKNKK